MTQPLVSFSAPASATRPTWVPSVNDIVSNFGQMARVLEIEADGGLVVVGIGFGGAVGQKWVAMPALCELVEHRN
jgi:hypothetical protein